MKVKIHEKKLVYDGFFKMENATLQHEKYDGTFTPKIQRLNLIRGDAATSVVYHKEKDAIILAKQFRYSTYEKGPGWLLELPAGMIAETEKPIDCMKRELVEETGYKAKNLEQITAMYMSPGGCNEVMFYFYTEVAEADKIAKGGGAADEHEDIEIIELPVSEIKSLLSSEKIHDGKTMFGLLWFMQNKLHP